MTNPLFDSFFKLLDLENDYEEARKKRFKLTAVSTTAVSTIAGASILSLASPPGMNIVFCIIWGSLGGFGSAGIAVFLIALVVNNVSNPRNEASKGAAGVLEYGAVPSSDNYSVGILEVDSERGENWQRLERALTDPSSADLPTSLPEDSALTL